MTDTSPNDEDLLDRALRAILKEAIPDSARQRALDRARAAHANPGTQPRLASPLDPGERNRTAGRVLTLPSAIAAVLIVAITVALLLPALSRARHQRGPRPNAPIQYDKSPAADAPPTTTTTTTAPSSGQPEPFPSAEAATKSSRTRQPPAQK